MDLVPLKKPYTLEEFKRKTDLYLQGMFGTSDKQFYIDKITEEYDKAKDAGLDTKAGIEFIKERNKMYKTLADEGRMQGEPAILGPSYGSTREEFAEGGNRINYADEYLSNKEFTNLYKQFSKQNPDGFTDPQFAEYLNNLNKKSKGNKNFTEKSVESRRNRLNIKSKSPLIFGSNKPISEFKKEAKKLDINTKGLTDTEIKNKVRNRRGMLVRQEKLKADPEYRAQQKKVKDDWAKKNVEKVKESHKKYRKKIYKKMGIPAPAGNAKEELFRSLFVDAQQYNPEAGKNRLQLVQDVKGGKSISKDNWINAKIIDTKTNKPITFNNLENYINNNTQFTFDEVIKPYRQKWFINDQGLRNIINEKMVPNWSLGDKRNYFEIQHNKSRWVDPFDVSLGTTVSNPKEFRIKQNFENIWNKNVDPETKKIKITPEVKQAVGDYKKQIKDLNIISKTEIAKRDRPFGNLIDFDKTLKNIKKVGANIPTKAIKDVAKYGLKSIPVIGSVFGLSEADKAYAAGVRNPLDLYLAAETDADTILKAREMRQDPRYGQKSLAGLESLPEVNEFGFPDD